ncbi:protein GET1 [Naematelia encephala]|uniref:Protein GET1 n=1 Tax=Naematelia encephala TaxID=71784 RepID=A0A1Y2BNE8_9TREE|nr:protein GET1 [Naematelia encephala]
MANLALLIFGVVFITQAVSWIGKSVLQELAFSLYARIFLSSLYSKQRTLRSQVLKEKADLAKTSSQDEFAKWAKLKRKVEKSLADLETINSQLGSAKTSFSLRFSSVLWLVTTGAQLVLVWWYRRQPVFYLPQTWTPGVVRWILSFPSAPSGSVSSGAWCTVCKRVLSTLEEIVKDLILPSGVTAPIPTAPVPATSEKTPAARIEPLEIEHDKLD